MIYHNIVHAEGRPTKWVLTKKIYARNVNRDSELFLMQIFYSTIWIQ